jgi:hypothetical protein
LLNHYVRKKKLADAMWTLKPNIPSQWKSTENIRHFDIDDQSESSRESNDEGETSDDDVKWNSSSDTYIDFKSSFVSYDTTPSVTDAPTTPITTQSETTPLYTESPTSPITTESITTPGVTEPGELEVTTEVDPDADPNGNKILHLT